MIPPSVASAIVRILGEDKTLIGTGFLFADLTTATSGVRSGAILTAKHVVEKSAALFVGFTANDALPAKVFERPVRGDWILLEVDGIPADRAPLPRGSLGNGANEVRWFSQGYASMFKNECGSFDGIVLAMAEGLQLRCAQLQGLVLNDASGLSGAPCIVAGEAVALITDVVQDNAEPKKIIGGQITAVPLGDIQPQRLRLPPCAGPELPWENVFTGHMEALQEGHRKSAAQAAGLGLNPVIGPRLPRQIARRMINQGILATARVLRQVRAYPPTTPQAIDQMMACAETLWVPWPAAECLARLAQAQRAAVIATERERSAQHHWARADDHSKCADSPWQSITVGQEHEEPFEESVYNEVRPLLRKLLGAADDTTLKRRLARRRIAVLVPGVPRLKVQERLHEDWPELVVIFLCPARPGVAGPADAGPIETVLPALTSIDEDRADEERADARFELSLSGAL